MKINLEDAWKRKQASKAGVSDKQGALDAIVSQQAAVGQELLAAKDADVKADDTLLAVVQAAPPDRTPVTSDGIALILVGGSLHANQTMPASDVTFDDGTAETPAQPAGSVTSTDPIPSPVKPAPVEATDGGIVLPTEPVVGV